MKIESWEQFDKAYLEQGIFPKVLMIGSKGWPVMSERIVEYRNEHGNLNTARESEFIGYEDLKDKGGTLK